MCMWFRKINVKKRKKKQILKVLQDNITNINKANTN